MATLFTRIIDGELPGRFVWKDSRCVAILTIAPLRPGHTLVIPREPVDHWIDLEPDLLQHLTAVAQHVARAVQTAFQPAKVGLMIAGLEVAHVHLHVSPIWELHDLDFARADAEASSTELDAAAERLREALRAAGHEDVSD